MSKLDSDVIKQAAAGKWIDILSSVAGVPIVILDSQHHPCPKCGGTDRFRMFDDGTGGVICNQCGPKLGDGFATVMWMLGCKFPEAVEKVANYLGFSPAKNKSGSKSKATVDPAKDLAFQPWNSLLAAHFLAAKKGTTEQSLLDQGCKMARYKTNTVIAWPVIGAALDTEKPVGYVVMEYKARPLPVYDREGNIRDKVEKKVLFGSKPGLIGVDAINKMKTVGMVDTIWKAEGLTDQAALWAAIPENLRAKHVVISTSCGANENPKWMGDVLSNYNLNVLHDCDEPGQAGAVKWSEFVSGRIAEGKQVRNIVLPYDIEPTKGKDVRDWFNEGSKFGDLLNLLEKTEPIVVARNEDGSPKDEEQSFVVQEMLMEKLQLRILESKEGGAVRVFSMLLRRSSTFSQISRLKEEDMVRMCGAPAMVLISDDPDHETTWSMKDIRKAIAFACSRHDSKADLHGVGVWQGLDDFGNETETMVLVNDTEAVRWNHDRVLRRVMEPMVDGLALNFGAGDQDWFDVDLLEQNLKNAEDIEWRRAVLTNANDLFAKWKWRNQEADPTLMVGLVLSAWIQTVWKWRPLVSIVGESGSGKSFLFQALFGSDHQRGIFGNLSFKQSKSTAAGIRQLVDQTGKIIGCDEFEHSKERIQIMEMFRASTRGDSIVRGTAGDQKGKKFALRHIAFTAAIEGGLQRQPDMNRFIQFELQKPERAEHGKLIMPGGRELYELGQKLLAISISLGIRAKNMAVLMKDAKIDIDARQVESYAVPVAILGLAYGFDEDKCRILLKELIEKTVDKDDQGNSDQMELLEAILSSTVFLGHPHGNISVAQIIEQPLAPLYTENAIKLEAVGIRLFHGKGLFINTNLMSRYLLRGTPWDGQSVAQILKRLPGAKSTQVRLSGNNLRGVMVPHELCKDIQAEENQAEFV